MFLNLDLLKPDVSVYVNYILKTDVPSNLMYQLNSKYIHGGPETAAPYVLNTAHFLQNLSISI